MADDIFLTPEEQDERAKQWLKDNGLAIGVGIGLGLAAVIGYGQYKDNLQIKAEQASALYGAALIEMGSSNLSDIDAQVVKLKKDHANTPYAAKAALLKARQLAVSDMPAALNELQWVLENALEAGLKHTARIRMAKIHIVLGDFDAAKVIASNQLNDNGFESHYHEILADISVKQGDVDIAREHYQQAMESLHSNDMAYRQVLSIKIDRLPASKEAASQEAVVDARNEVTE